MPSRAVPAAPAATLNARRIGHERAGRVVLDDVSLSVGPDTCLGLVGPNGVGKSTLLQILAGLITPASGRVVVDPPTATVGYLSQEHEVVPGETVRDSLLRRTGLVDAENELASAAAVLGAGRTGDGGPLRECPGQVRVVVRRRLRSSPHDDARPGWPP